MTFGKLTPFLSFCAALCMVAVLSGCIPKQFLRISDPAAQTEEAVGQQGADSALQLELDEVTADPRRVVSSSDLQIMQMSDHYAIHGEELRLSEEDLALDLPFGLLALEGDGPVSGPVTSHEDVGQAEPPRLSKSEERTLAARNTRQALCSGGDSVCITSPFGVRRSHKRIHKGIDIRAPLGSPIMALRGGTVLRAQYHRTYGYLVEIQQDDGLVARYAHMSQILTTKGARVRNGNMIGRVGSTGRSTGPHLHFELLRDNRQTNPMAYLPKLDYVVVKGTEADAAAARAALAKSGKGGKKSKAAKSRSKSRSRSGKADLRAMSHTIRNGDTLSGIALEYGTSVKAIQAANGGPDRLKVLRVGKSIKLPKRR